MKNTEVGRITKRLVMSVAACAMVWYFLDKHRDWVWAYFATLAYCESTTPEQTKLAEASISAITTVALSGIGGIIFIAAWFITGNVVALTQMFKFNAATNLAGSVVSSVVSTHTDSVQREIKAAEKKFAGDPSYRPLESLPDKDAEDFR